MRTLHLIEEAAQDLDDAADFYDRQEKGLGDRFHSTLLAEMRRLAPIAGSHRKRHGFHCYLSETFPYGVYYRVNDEVVAIYAILDLRRNPRALSRVLSGR